MGSARPAPRLKAFAAPVAWVAAFGTFVLWMWNPVHDVRLMTSGRAASAEILGTSTDVEGCDSGGDCTRTMVGYRFQAANGSWYEGSARLNGGPPPGYSAGNTVSVRYLPANPDISRLSDQVSESPSQWLFKLVGFLVVCWFGWLVAAPLFKQALAGPQAEADEAEERD